MGDTNSTIDWPKATTISPKVKDTIELFYSLVDQKTPDAGPQLASEVFASDGKFMSSTATCEGKDEISRSRQGVWDAFDSRRHDILKVYASDAEGNDIIVLGKMNAVLKTGGEIVHSFAARVVFNAEGTGADASKIKLYEVWVKHVK